MKVLSHPDLHCRDFGSTLLSVVDFKEWLKENRLRIFTIPNIDDFDFVQVESLLCAVERAAGEITDAEAKEIVSADPFLAKDRMAIAAPRWLVGADAHRKWRIKITQALLDGQMVLLDFGSKLPVAIPADALIAAAEFSPTAEQLGRGIYAPAKLNPMEHGDKSRPTPPVSDVREPGLSKRERQIRAIESTAHAAGYVLLSIPDGGKKTLRNACMKSHPELFGGGDSPFDDAWKVAIAATPPRLRMANHRKFARRE